jgi:pimeloyl-ACP methyl ester carboxylesterase
LADQYYQALKAPGKKLVWFEHSAHLLNAEEPEKFNEFFVKEVLSIERV